MLRIWGCGNGVTWCQSDSVTFRALISNWTCHQQCYLLAIFHPKKGLDGDFPRKDLGPLQCRNRDQKILGQQVMKMRLVTRVQKWRWTEEEDNDKILEVWFRIASAALWRLFAYQASRIERSRVRGAMQQQRQKETTTQ